MMSYGTSHILPTKTKIQSKSSSFLAVERQIKIKQTPGVGTYRPNYNAITKHVPEPIITSINNTPQFRRKAQLQ